MTKIVDLRDMEEELLYSETQCNDNIKDGDILVCQGMVAIMVKAWPVSIGQSLGGFHTLAEGITWETFENGKYLNSYKLAKEQ